MSREGVISTTTSRAMLATARPSCFYSKRFSGDYTRQPTFSKLYGSMPLFYAELLKYA